MNEVNLINYMDKIYIAGHKGMVGSAIKKKFIENNYKNILTTTRKELDLMDQNSVLKWFSKNKPNVVILAAAKVGGINANNKFSKFLLENMKIQIM